MQCRIIDELVIDLRKYIFLEDKSKTNVFYLALQGGCGQQWSDFEKISLKMSGKA
jgi:hypothetical protein